MSGTEKVSAFCGNHVESKAVVSVKTSRPYVLWLEFEGGERRRLDMRPFLDVGRFAELKSESAFESARVAFDAVEWENGLDLDPEFAYAKSVPAEQACVAEENERYGSRPDEA